MAISTGSTDPAVGASTPETVAASERADRADAVEAAAAREKADRVEALLEQLESLSDPAARDAAYELITAMLELYGAGLGRLTQIVARSADESLTRQLATDDLLSHLLLLHDLHPWDTTARVRAALERLRPRLTSATVELVKVADGSEGAPGVVGTVRLRRSVAGGCGASERASREVRDIVEGAVRDAAPELERVEIVETALPGPEPTVIPVESVTRRVGWATGRARSGRS